MVYQKALKQLLVNYVAFPRNHMKKHSSIGRVLLHVITGNGLRRCSSGYETDERSSLGSGAAAPPGAEAADARDPQPRHWRAGAHKPGPGMAMRQGGAKP
jgi:hypothetical protein